MDPDLTGRDPSRARRACSAPPSSRRTSLDSPPGRGAAVTAAVALQHEGLASTISARREYWVPSLRPGRCATASGRCTRPEEGPRRTSSVRLERPLPTLTTTVTDQRTWPSSWAGVTTSSGCTVAWGSLTRCLKRRRPRRQVLAPGNPRRGIPRRIRGFYDFLGRTQPMIPAGPRSIFTRHFRDFSTS